MKKHLVLTIFAAMYLGYGFAFAIIGMKSGITKESVYALSITSFIFWVFIAFTSLHKLSTKIEEFENKNKNKNETTTS